MEGNSAQTPTEVSTEPMEIQILPAGPYYVRGNVPLDERIIRPDGCGYRWEDGRELPQSDEYYLCRCGRSKNPPFCDNSHERYNFVGTESADKTPYIQRAVVVEGPAINLADDKRCAFVRLCHAARDNDGTATNAWELAANASTDLEVAFAQSVIDACPAGRLTVSTHEGEMIEPSIEPGITVVQDAANGVSAGLYIHGNVIVIGADGETYETRSRSMLCRCGYSRNKPFCDAIHVPMQVNDGFLP